MNIEELITSILSRLGGHSETPRLDVEIFLLHILKKDRTWLIANNNEEVSQDINYQLQELISQRIKGVPVAYLTGNKEFYGLNFKVSPAVLIPRPETEMIVDEALKLNPAPKNVLEIGVGSGCIIISILSELNKKNINPKASATDISEDAIKIAKDNAKFHKVDAQINFQKVDLFPEANQKFDLIVSNPPYIPSGSSEISVGTKFEPELALYSGDDGLKCIRRIAERLPDYLTPGGVFLMEFGINQSEAVKGIFSNLGFQSLTILPDLAGIPRVLRLS